MKVENLRSLASGCIIAGLFLSHVNIAQADAAAAEALFIEGRELMGQGQYALACAKFAESQRLDPSSGTQLNLGDCYAKQGKTASAWAEFLAAARLAEAQKRPERAAEARQRANQLEGQLSYLTLRISAEVPGLEIYRDNITLEPGAMGARIPVDPGKHTLRATAPDHHEWSANVMIGPSGDEQTVEIPTLKRLSEPPRGAREGAKTVPAPQPAPSTDQGAATEDSSKTTAYVIGGAGVLTTAVGAVFGFMALSSNSKAEEACPTLQGCSQDALDKRERAELQANIANVGIGLGVVGIAVGTVLLVTGGSSDEAPRTQAGVWMGPAIGRTGAATVFGGRF